MKQNEKVISNVTELFDYCRKITVPAYQRAYSWERKQLEQFMFDLESISSKGGYYYGHFIFEKDGSDFVNLEVIDGQQRLTTLVLFLLSCNQIDEDIEILANIIQKFETVSFDQESYELLKIYYLKNKAIPILDEFKVDSKHTLSIRRIFDALKFFHEKLGKKDIEIVKTYRKVLLDAHISIHTSNDKAVSSQIFELHNSRGVSLTLMDKVKSKLMKSVYQKSMTNADDDIRSIQANFAKIYEQEELIMSNSFRGNISLEEILHYHLRVVGDGEKIKKDNKHLFDEPQMNNREENILLYLDSEIENDSRYPVNLVEEFRKTVDFICTDLLDFDKSNHLIGDSIILDRKNSIEFFILLNHKFEKDDLKSFFLDVENLKVWEKLLFTRNYHDGYFGLKYGDDFSALLNIIALKTKIEDVMAVILDYVEKGFRPDKITIGLQEYVMDFIKRNEEYLLKRAYNWSQDKNAYILYKYEIEKKNANLEEMREIIKSGRSIEHILPQSWAWEFINDNEVGITIKDKYKDFDQKITQLIDGLGNLLLVKSTENSRLGNNHPKDKLYESCLSGSYKEHNENPERWTNHENWENNILDRGKDILRFMNEYFFKEKIKFEFQKE